MVICPCRFQAFGVNFSSFAQANGSRYVHLPPERLVGQIALTYGGEQVRVVESPVGTVQTREALRLAPCYRAGELSYLVRVEVLAVFMQGTSYQPGSRYTLQASSLLYLFDESIPASRKLKENAWFLYYIKGINPFDDGALVDVAAPASPIPAKPTPTPAPAERDPYADLEAWARPWWYDPNKPKFGKR